MNVNILIYLLICSWMVNIFYFLNDKHTFGEMPWILIFSLISAPFVLIYEIFYFLINKLYRKIRYKLGYSYVYSTKKGKYYWHKNI